MRSKRMQSSLMVAAMFAALACSDDGRDLGTHDDEAREHAALDTGGKSEEDIDLSQRIRSGITSVDAMSEQARNVRVISQDGVVTLRGPVESEQEKATIETLARNAGATRIDNQLEIDRDS